MEINKDHLSEEQIQVTQFCGTEPPFSGKLLDEKRKGEYICTVCKEVLFDSTSKYESDHVGQVSLMLQKGKCQRGLITP
jgi:Conserved domain frequently associated with peptide methionine sulfoxide reductase